MSSAEETVVRLYNVVVGSKVRGSFVPSAVTDRDASVGTRVKVTA